MDPRRVAVSYNPGSAYPVDPPFHPGTAYPEYPFGVDAVSRGSNDAYAGVRHSLALLGLDREAFDTPAWNPLSFLIRPGGSVVIKPNMVRDWHDEDPSLDPLLTTHGSVIRAVLDYTVIALGGSGSIIIADSCQNDANHKRLVDLLHLNSFVSFLSSRTDIHFEIRDLRPERVDKIEGLIVKRHTLPGDPEGYTEVDLGENSAFCDLDSEILSLLYGAETDDERIALWHGPDKHIYQFCNTFLNADAIIEIPKLKTHRKSGITVCLKSFIGLLGYKTIVPHFRMGHPDEGGDQFNSGLLRNRVETVVTDRFHYVFRRLGPVRKISAGMLRAAGNVLFGRTDEPRIRSGNWHGNDTIWRTVLDAGRILLESGPDGVFEGQTRRNVFFIVDGITGGERNGPLAPDPREAGVILTGMHPAAVDAAAARVMGFEPGKIPLVRESFSPNPHSLAPFGIDEVSILSNEAAWEGPLPEFDGPGIPFAPHRGWVGHIEAGDSRISV